MDTKDHKSLKESLYLERDQNKQNKETTLHSLK